ncbi:MAG: SDR family oxidoreductase [Myxococcota bacterium]|nr:SDR family oxidoreductase [Myxococcota bacterium]
MKTAFVTGATGLLGNNLCALLLEQGWRVRALARDPDKAGRLLPEHPTLEVVVGDLLDLPGFQERLDGVDVLFHTAAYFRESFGGGNHWPQLERINVQATAELLEAAYAQGVRRMVHTSSIAVLHGPRGAPIDEEMLREDAQAHDPYYRSKVLADRAALAFLARHPQAHLSLVLPGWMVGPGDLGPTPAGQFTMDYLGRKLPGVPPASFSVVDARDVAKTLLAAAERGRSGVRYLAAGRHLSAQELFAVMEQVSGQPAPTRKVPPLALMLVSVVQELVSRITGKPALLSWASVRRMLDERDRTHFDPRRSARELGVSFRPVEQTFSDQIRWYQQAGWLSGEQPPRPVG